jgi:hypothetical protein
MSYDFPSQIPCVRRLQSASSVRRLDMSFRGLSTMSSVRLHHAYTAHTARCFSGEKNLVPM